MSELTLVIGNKNYSSWSLRPWLALRHAGIPFTDKMILLSGDNWEKAIAAVSPSRRVPVLLHGERTIWESLAILEYVHELSLTSACGPRIGKPVRWLVRSPAKCMPALLLFGIACP